MEGARPPSLGDRLIEAGWEQGVVFEASGAAVCFNESASGDGGQAGQRAKKIKSKDLLVVVSQTCDICASEAYEPYVEAMVCKFESERFVNKAKLGSARFFVLDFDRRLVVHAPHRVLFAKELLLDYRPSSWLSSRASAYRFADWLARRYDRPALPDELVAAFQRPVRDELLRMMDEDPQTAGDFSRVVAEMRLSLPQSENPPFDVQLVLLTETSGLTAKESDAIERVIEQIRRALDPELIHLDPIALPLTPERMSLAHYRETRIVYLDQLTYEGEEVTGAEPLRRI